MTDLTLPAFTVAPTDATAPGPGVLVVHEGNGISAQLVRYCERLAREGYRVIAPDFFSRSHGVDPADFGAIIASITPEHLKGDFAAGIEQLRAGGASKVGVTGFCMGGWFTYRAAKWADDLGVNAAVPFYGGGIARDLGDLHCPTLMFFGDEDPYIPMSDVEAVRARHGDAVVVYPGADHGFMRDGSENYDEASATDAWGRLLAFFGEHLR
jgi:carboxymethylenebutenolidase